MNKENKYSRIGLVWSYVRNYKWTVCGAEICLLFIFAQSAILPMITSIMVDEVFYNQNISVFISIIGLYALIFLGARLSNLMYQPLWQYLTNNYVYDVSKSFFSKNLRAKASCLYNKKTGDILTRVNNEAFEFIYILIRNGLRSLNRLFVFIFAFIMLFFIHWSLAIYSIVVIPTLVFFTKKSSKNLSDSSSELTVKNGLFSNWLFEMISGLREIRLLSMQKYTKGYLSQSQKDIIYLDNRIAKINYVSNLVQNVIILFCQLIFFTLCAYLMIDGKITIGFFLAANEYYTMMYDTLRYVVSLYLDWQRRKIYVDRLHETLQLATEIDNQPPLKIKDGVVEFEDVIFGYTPELTILNHFSLKIETGQKIALVGESGAGKSTISYLLLRFHDPDFGSIKIDGQDISKHSYYSIRDSIGIIQQDIIFFNGTIRGNIDVGKRKHTDSELEEACKKANILSYIKTLPNGFDTIIGEDGINMSGGQKQRLMIARLFLKDPHILIMDEATSALDQSSENYIQNEINELSKGRTTIIIAHRYSAIKNVDLIAFIENGRVADIGTNEELLQRCSGYKKLFYDQVKLEASLTS